MAKRIRFERGQELQEHARTVAAICIQPHVRKRIIPRQLLPLPWDNKKSEIRNNAPSAHSRGKEREVLKTLIRDYKVSNNTSFIEFAVFLRLEPFLPQMILIEK